MKSSKLVAAALAASLLMCSSNSTAWAIPKPSARTVLTVALITKCNNPNVYRNYSIGDPTNWVKVSPYLKGTTHYYGIMFEGGYSVVAVTMGSTSATLKIISNGERLLRYVSGCPSTMKISYKYVWEYGDD